MIDEFRVFKKIRLAGTERYCSNVTRTVAGRGREGFTDMFFLLEFSPSRNVFIHEAKYGQGLNNRYNFLIHWYGFEDAETNYARHDKTDK
jgi:hypothetical protein